MNLSELKEMQAKKAQEEPFEEEEDLEEDPLQEALVKMRRVMVFLSYIGDPEMIKSVYMRERHVAERLAVDLKQFLDEHESDWEE